MTRKGSSCKRLNREVKGERWFSRTFNLGLWDGTCSSPQHQDLLVNGVEEWRDNEIGLKVHGGP